MLYLPIVVTFSCLLLFPNQRPESLQFYNAEKLPPQLIERIQEIYQPIIKKQGYFIAGKFDRAQQKVPGSAVVKAFQELLQQILAESEERFKQWRAKLLAALVPNAQVIIEVIPDLELIIGQQPAVPELEQEQERNRFNSVFVQFLQVFCSKEHPLVIFLDDLHLADSPSLKLIQLMAAAPMASQANTNLEDSEPITATESPLAQPECLLIVGAYSDNEVSPVHPLIVAATELRKQGATVWKFTYLCLFLCGLGRNFELRISRH
jgi:predicted ATPase